MEARNLLWAKRAGGTGSGPGFRHCGGWLGEQLCDWVISMDRRRLVGEANQTTLISAGGDDIFVAQYDSSGVLQWAKRAGGTGLDRGGHRSGWFGKQLCDWVISRDGDVWSGGSEPDHADFCRQ